MLQYVLDHGVPERVLGTVAKVAGASAQIATQWKTTHAYL